MRVLFLSVILCCSCNSHAQFWYQIADFSSTERDDAVSFTIGDKVYCGTGSAPWFAPLGTFAVFNMFDETWTAGVALPPGEERQYATAFSYGNSGFVFGGLDTTFLSDLWQFESSSQTWIPKAAIPGLGRADMASFVIDSLAFIVGGRSTSNAAMSEVWAYDMVNNNWIQKNDFPNGGLSRAEGASIGGLGYVLFGRDTSALIRRELYEYDPVNDSWTVISQFPLDGRTYSTLTAYGNDLFVIAGMDSTMTYYGDLWRYRPTTGNWTQLNSIPDKSRRGGLAFTNGSSIFYTTGSDSVGTRLKETWKNSIPNSIEQITSFKINIFPNPTTNILTVDFEQNTLEYSVLDLWGRTIISGKMVKGNGNISVGELIPGSYILCVQSDNSFRTLPFIKK